MAKRIVDLLEPVEIEHHQRAAALGGLVGCKRCRETLCHAVTVGKTGQRIVLRHARCIELALADYGDVLCAATIAEEFAVRIILRLGIDRPPDFPVANGKADRHLDDRTARSKHECKRASGPPLFLVVPLGKEQSGKRGAQNVRSILVELACRARGKVAQCASGVGSPEPTKARFLEFVEKGQSAS
ncbi:hypothetical protein ACWPMX_04955 [Tsuneonella sp. HG094]